MRLFSVDANDAYFFVSFSYVGRKLLIKQIND